MIRVTQEVIGTCYLMLDHIAYIRPRLDNGQGTIIKLKNGDSWTVTESVNEVLGRVEYVMSGKRYNYAQ